MYSWTYHGLRITCKATVPAVIFFLLPWVWQMTWVTGQFKATGCLSAMEVLLFQFWCLRIKKGMKGFKEVFTNIKLRQLFHLEAKTAQVMWKLYSSNMQQYSFFYRFLQWKEVIILSILWIWKKNSSEWACLDYAVKANYISYRNCQV